MRGARFAGSGARANVHVPSSRNEDKWLGIVKEPAFAPQRSPDRQPSI